MKKNILVAGVIALSLSLGFTGCVSNSPEPAPKSTLSATLTEPVDSSEEAMVAFRYQQFLDGAFKADIKVIEKLQEDVSQYSGDNPSDENKEKILNLMVEAFPSLEVIYTEEMTLDEKGTVYGSLIGGAGLMAGYGYSIEAPKKAVTVTDNSAVLDAKQLVVNAPKGEEFDATEITDSGPANFIKVNDVWYLLVEPLEADTAPAEDAPVEAPVE